MSDTEANAISSTVTPAGDENVEQRAEMARALARGGMSDVQVISWESAREITPERRRILETLRAYDVESVTALADHLGRDKSQVSRDLATLAELGVLTLKENGRRKQPVLTQDTLVVEPLV